MQKAKKGTKAVAFGLTAVLALTPALGPAGVAYADENDQDANNAEVQNVEEQNTSAETEAAATEANDESAVDTQSIGDDFALAWWKLQHEVVHHGSYDPHCPFCQNDRPGHGEQQQEIEFNVMGVYPDGTTVELGVINVDKKATGADVVEKIKNTELKVPDGYAVDINGNLKWMDGSKYIEPNDKANEHRNSGISVNLVANSEEPPAEEPAEQINVQLKYGDNVLAAVADENGLLSSDILNQIDLTGIVNWTWIDSEGTEHTTAGADLSKYIFSESCTITANYESEEPPAEEPAEQINVQLKYGDNVLAAVADENGLLSSDILNQIDLTGIVNWTWIDSEGTEHTTAGADLSKYIFSESCTITANYESEEPAQEQNYITVNYYDGDKLLGTGAVLNGTSDWSGIANPSKDGYTFLGWQFEGEDAIYTDAELDNVVYAADEGVTEINLYAQWQENTPAQEQRYITVNYYDGDKLLGTGAVLNGTSDWSGIANPSKEGYTFLGWQFEGEDAIYTDAELDNVVYAADEGVTEINLYAQWQENTPAQEQRYITVHFYDEFGTFLGDGAVLNGTSDWSYPVAPEIDGYTFEGWAEEGGSVYSPELLGQVVVAVPEDVTELTYIAHYKANEPQTITYKVTFDDCLPSTDDNVVEVEAGQTVAKPADPTNPGWAFVGWFTDKNLTQEYDFTTPVNSDITLYAKWVEDKAAGSDTEGSETPTTPSDEATTDEASELPQTGDSTLPFAAGAAALAGAAAVAGATAMRKRNSSK